MQYQDYEYLWPPRPEKAIPRAMLPIIERKGWVAQAKKNGTCNVIAVSPEKRLICMNRHKETHKLWTPSEASSRAFRALPGRGWYVFVAELLHSKIAAAEGGVRDTNFINDILVCDGEYLVGQTFVQRQTLLRDLFLTAIPEHPWKVGPAGETESHWLIDENTWLAKTKLANFTQFYDSLDKPEDEGIVMKNPDAILAYCSREKANVDWSIKSRRVHKNFSF